MEELNFKDVLTIIWRKKISIIVIITISIIIGSVYTFKYTTPRYKSSASVILGKVSSASNGEVLESEKDITMSDLNLNSSLIDTYSELVRSRSIMESVSQRLNHTISVDSLMESVSVARVGSSDLLQVTATNNDPVIAKNIVTEVVDVFSEYVKEIYKIENVYIIDQPSIEYVPYNINHVRDIAISILMGLIISILYVYIYSFVDNTVKSSKDIEELLNVKTLINIPFDKNIFVNYDEISEDIVEMITKFKNTTGMIIETDGGYLEFETDGRTKILGNGEFYKALDSCLKSMNKNSYFWSASMMLEDEWTEEPKEMKFRVSNLDVSNRGTKVERIFVFSHSKIKEFKNNKTLKIFMQSNINTMYVDYDEILEKEPELLEIIGNGWDGIDLDTLIVDAPADQEGNVRGYLSINKREIKRAYDCYLRLKNYAKDLKEVLK